MIPLTSKSLGAPKQLDLLWSRFRLNHALHHFGQVIKAYDPDQPRAPAGTEEAGQWISAGGASGDEIVVAGGFSKNEREMSVQEFIAKNCEGRVNRRVPGEFLNIPINELLKLRIQGVPNADRCYKILNDNRFRK